jgi:hypothetical protein
VKRNEVRTHTFDAASLLLSMLPSSLGAIIARKAEHATEVIVRLSKAMGTKAVVCGTEKRRENLRPA